LDLQGTIQWLKAERDWLDQLIDSVEDFRDSPTYQAVSLLDRQLARPVNGKPVGLLSSRSQRELSRLLQQARNGR